MSLNTPRLLVKAARTEPTMILCMRLSATCWTPCNKYRILHEGSCIIQFIRQVKEKGQNVRLAEHFIAFLQHVIGPCDRSIIYHYDLTGGKLAAST